MFYDFQPFEFMDDSGMWLYLMLGLHLLLYGIQFPTDRSDDPLLIKVCELCVSESCGSKLCVSKMCVCVWVKHLNRCKTSTVIIFSCDLLRFTFSFRLFNVPLQSFVFIMSNQFSEDTAGGLEPICLSSPTKLWHIGGWVVWSTTCTCFSLIATG